MSKPQGLHLWKVLACSSEQGKWGNTCFHCTGSESGRAFQVDNTGRRSSPSEVTIKTPCPAVDDVKAQDSNVRHVIRVFVLIRFRLNAIKLITVHLKGSLRHHADHRTGWKAGLILSQLDELSGWCRGLLQEPKIGLRRASLKYLSCRYTDTKAFGLSWVNLGQDLHALKPDCPTNVLGLFHGLRKQKHGSSAGPTVAGCCSSRFISLSQKLLVLQLPVTADTWPSANKSCSIQSFIYDRHFPPSSFSLWENTPPECLMMWAMFMERVDNVAAQYETGALGEG
ncbi:Astrotactin-1 [Anabarilius grahami]|uniref:Astrotactin-1 n=1 Tax=Anabarilius grahami TaxID=495550 RepID=A0A3N0YE71_ANAGA|nr:Astrotactin-1 [Anabarilius grahami]